MLKKLNLFELAKRIKRKFVQGKENAFKPADPRTLISVNKCFDWLHKNGLIEGSDYLEFGLFRGFNFWYTQALSKSLEITDMRYFGFDSFFGLPPITGIDKEGSFREGEFYSSLDEVKSFLNRFGVNWDKTVLIEGFYNKTLIPQLRQEYSMRRFSLCVIDCDLYESARDVLKFIEPLVGHLSLLYFDDWDDFGINPEMGEQKAFSEFLNRNSHIHAEPFNYKGGKGKAFILYLIDKDITTK